ncbi:MetQ/NlpA family ABC transporter substrate-binding protein [Cytobacillus purgationiresistens]|uniref:Lipoprotein n=1 Tax=Cytobacillus purgationiresistens TaxID=863449 RepID=A0ABU0AEH1_9BACI|nr:MetQ/NlpA family ABC transporter substrate-binding protein [Cytobacillus purgationiresistens]MDQ0268833.1 D-methionine transport system substrate-binding protein [Cytobacillus purgationiresistens]
MKKIWLTFILVGFVIGLSACSSATSEEKRKLVFGATVPYSDMLKEGVVPILEKKGYSVEVKEFNDYVQPNIALDSGDLDANLFQHKVYLENFNKEKGLELIDVVSVPTAPIGIYSVQYGSLDEIKEGSTVAIANDPTNLARGLTVLRDAGLLKLAEEINPVTVTVKDIEDNPKNLKFHEVDAAQLPRSLESVDLAAVNGNFAVAAGLDLTTAIYRDQIPDEIQNRIVVRDGDKDQQFVKDIIESVESKEFLQVIDKHFQGFHKPKWMEE